MKTNSSYPIISSSPINWCESSIIGGQSNRSASQKYGHCLRPTNSGCHMERRHSIYIPENNQRKLQLGNLIRTNCKVVAVEYKGLRTLIQNLSDIRSYSALLSSRKRKDVVSQTNDLHHRANRQFFHRNKPIIVYHLGDSIIRRSHVWENNSNVDDNIWIQISRHSK